MTIQIPLADNKKLVLACAYLAVGSKCALSSAQTHRISDVRGCLPTPGEVLLDTQGRAYKWITERLGTKHHHSLERIK